MKRLLLTTMLCVFAFPALANDPNWNGDPEPPTEPEPEPEPQKPSRPTESWADRNDSKPMSQALPCCIMDGQLVLTPTLFMSAKRALEKCNKAKANGSALIYECPGSVSPKALK
jgi:hypothetical protein